MRTLDPWETVCRWEWFHREHGRSEFRTRKRGSPTAFQRLVDERGGGPVLDASCGLGLTKQFAAAGFTRLETRTFPGLGTNGSTFTLNVATR